MRRLEDTLGRDDYSALLSASEERIIRLKENESFKSGSDERKLFN